MALKPSYTTHLFGYRRDAAFHPNIFSWNERRWSNGRKCKGQSKPRTLMRSHSLFGSNESGCLLNCHARAPVP
jgi:hypothetical protein